MLSVSGHYNEFPITPPKHRIAVKVRKAARSTQALYDVLSKAKKYSNATRLGSELGKMCHAYKTIHESVEALVGAHVELLGIIDSLVQQCSESVATVRKRLGVSSIGAIFFANRLSDLSDVEVYTSQEQFQHYASNLELCANVLVIDIKYRARRRSDGLLLGLIEKAQRIVDDKANMVDPRLQSTAMQYLAEGTLLYVSRSVNDLPTKHELTSTTQIQTRTDSDKDSDTDSFCDLLTLRSQDHMLAGAWEAISKQQYTEAERTATNYLVKSQDLLHFKQNDRDIKEAHLLQMLCAYQHQRSTAAFHTLISAVNDAEDSKGDDRVTYLCLQFLGQTCLECNDLNQATMVFEIAIRKLIQTHNKIQEIYSMLARLALLYKAQKDLVHTAAYQILIPPEERVSLLQQMGQTLPGLIRTTGVSSVVLRSEAAKIKRRAISIKYTPTKMMEFGKRLFIMNDRISAVAWSQDNRMLAIGLAAINRRIELCYTANRKTIRRLNISSFYAITCISFDANCLRLAAAFVDDVKSSKNLHFQVWEVQTGRTIRKMTLFRSEEGLNTSDVEFNPFDEDQICVCYTRAYCAEYGFFICNIKQGTVIARKTIDYARVEPIWTADSLLFSGYSSSVSFRTSDYNQPGEYSEYKSALGCSKGCLFSGVLYSMDLNGSIGISTKDAWITQSPTVPPVPPASVSKSYLTFNKRGVMIVLLRTCAGELYLRAPLLQKWILIATEVDLMEVFGLTPDAEYAYLTGWSDDKGTHQLNILNVDDFLELGELSCA